MKLVGRRPQLVALMAWYDESPAMLHDSLSSLAPHIDLLVAADGSYPYYPDGNSKSPREQHDAIRDALAPHKTKWEVITPGQVWDNEVHKRNFLFEYAADCALEGEDWFLVWDADFFIDHCDEITEELDATDAQVATVTLKSLPPSREPPMLAHRLLYRAHPSLQCVGKHNVYAYTNEDDYVYVWGHQDMLPAADLTDKMTIRHDPGRRLPDRMAKRDIWFNRQGRIEAKEYAHDQA